MRMRASLRLVLLGALGCSSEQGLPRPLTISTRPACSETTACLNSNTQTLDVSGVTVIHKRIEGHPMAAVRLLFARQEESEQQRWSEQLALDILDTNGAGEATGDGWAQAWAAIGGTSSAYASWDYSVVTGSAPLPMLDAMWGLLSDAVAQPSLSQYEFDGSREQIIRAVRLQDEDALTAARVDCYRRALANTPYGRQYDDPTVLLNRLSLPDTAGAWIRLRDKGRLLVTVAGDVEEARVRNWVGGAFSDWPKNRSTPPYPPPAAVSANAEVVLAYPDSPTWHIASCFVGPSAAHDDYAPLALGIAVLSTRLFQKIRDELGLAYATGASLSFFRQTFGAIQLSTTAPVEAIEAAAEVLLDLKTQGPTQQELDAAYQSIRTRLLSGSASPADLASTLADWQLTAGDREGVDELLNRLPTIGAAQVAAAVTRYVAAAKSTAAGAGATLNPRHLATLYLQNCDEPECATEGTCRVQHCANGTCKFFNLLDGTRCNAESTCESGVCGREPSGGNTVPGETIDAGGAAGVLACSSARDCDDGNRCNGQETCGPDETCQPGQRLACNDSDPCTVDECIPALGCNFPRVADGTLCGLHAACSQGICVSGTGCGGDLECDDAEPCNGAERCTLGICQAGQALFEQTTCGLRQACFGGRCSGVECTADTECDDGNVCNGQELCTAELRCTTAPALAPDGFACGASGDSCVGGLCSREVRVPAVDVGGFVVSTSPAAQTSARFANADGEHQSWLAARAVDENTESEQRPYFMFSIPEEVGLVAPVAATLRLWVATPSPAEGILGVYDSPAPSETFVLHSVVSPPSFVLELPFNAAIAGDADDSIFVDLGDGPTLGERIFTPADALPPGLVPAPLADPSLDCMLLSASAPCGRFIDIPLNAAALVEIAAHAGSQWLMGGRLIEAPDASGRHAVGDGVAADLSAQNHPDLVSFTPPLPALILRFPSAQ
jgi:predicted Zn-dependent peptidase